MIHDNFILTPISINIDELTKATLLQSSQMENCTITEYILQTLFLKMTGFQEQKCKCVCWELASSDYDYRFEFLKKMGNLGEFSTLDAKEYVYSSLIAEIKKYDETFVVKDFIGEKRVVTDALARMEIFHKRCNLLHPYSRDYYVFKRMFKNATNIVAVDDKLILGNVQLSIPTGSKIKFSDIYSKYVYRHRNRCAHNLLSYQSNKPTMTILGTDEFVLENYYIRFFVVMIIDDVIRYLFEKYNKLRLMKIL